MADFARMPTSRKVLVFVVAGALLGALYFQFLYKPLNEEVDTADAEHSSKVAQNNQLDKDIVDFKALKQRMCLLKRVIDENQTALPTEAELPAFFETLNRKVLESGVEVRRWEQKPEEKVESFFKVPVQIELTGTYMQIKKFFASLIEKKRKPGATPPPVVTDTGCGNAPIEEHERIVSIENLNLTSPTVVNHEIVLTARFTAATYRAEDKNAGGPPVRKATPPAPPAPPAGTGTGSAAAAPPPANAATPAAVRARTDKAMEKDDDRTRKAPETQPDGSAKLKGGL